MIKNNTNAMDADRMPSEKAQAARMKSAEVMAALKKGQPGDADALMAPQKPEGSQNLLPLQWIKSKVTHKSK